MQERETDEQLKCPSHMSDAPTVHFEKDRPGEVYWVCDTFGRAPKHYGKVRTQPGTAGS